MCPTTIHSLSCFGPHFSYKTLPTVTRATAGSRKMVFMPSKQNGRYGEKSKIGTSKIWKRKRLENTRDPF